LFQERRRRVSRENREVIREKKKPQKDRKGREPRQRGRKGKGNAFFECRVGKGGLGIRTKKKNQTSHHASPKERGKGVPDEGG